MTAPDAGPVALRALPACAINRLHASIRRLMNPRYADADILTSAYMAAGMTSRARRPLPPPPVG